jgi:hypothetical protein
MTEIKLEEPGNVDFAVREHRSLWLDAWRRLIASNTARAGMFVVLLFMLSSTLAHYFWEYNPKIDLDYSAKLNAPNLVVSEESPRSTSLERTNWGGISSGAPCTAAGTPFGLAWSLWASPYWPAGF